MDPYNDPSITAPVDPDLLVTDLLETFRSHYNGNRAPFGIYTHPVWLGPAQQAIPDGRAKFAAVNRFLDAAAAMPDVWFVTTSQLVDYMKNPVSAAQLGSQPYMQCPRIPTGICNGLTPGLAESCSFPSGLFRVNPC